jgi:phosphoglycolate phosphatase
MIRLIAFDLDGTLIDSRRDIADSANEMLSQYGAPALTTEAVVAMVGEGARLLITRVLAAAKVDAPVDEALPRFLDIYERHLVAHTRPYPGIPEALGDLLRRSKLAVLTNKPRHAALEILDHFDLLDLFVDVIGGDGQVPRKPDPAGLDALRAQVNARPEETLMIGDSWVDVETARQARARAALVTWGFGAPPPDGLRPNEYALHHPGELPGLVARLNANGSHEGNTWNVTNEPAKSE